LAFRTEAAARFEKGIDTEGILDVLRRATHLAKKTSGAKIASELIDIYPKKQIISPIRLNINKLNSYLGIQINIQKAVKILESLGFKATANPGRITATPPTYRANDVLIDVDLIEEIARIYGYHNLPSTQPQGLVPKSQTSDLERALALKNALKYLGLTEVITYSIVSKDMLKISGTAEKEAVKLSNPLTEEWQFMRPTVIPSLVDVLAKNKNLDNNLKIFELAKTYTKEKRGLPKQDLILNLAQNGSDFYEIKGLVDAIFVILKHQVGFSKLNNANTMYEYSQSAQIKIGDEVVGVLGVLKNSISEHFGLENQIAAAEINLTQIYQHSSLPQSYRPISKFPPVIEDISAIFSVYTPIADIIAEIKKASTLVKNVEVIDIFEGVNIEENKKSVTLRLTYQKPTETPSQQEVNDERTGIANALQANLRAKIRK
jgi:phenylalanyl-tRNA synthetase beta chain